MRIRKFHRDPEVAAISYMIIKEQGICVRCMANWAEQGAVHCWGCREYSRLQTQKQKKLKKQPYIIGGKAVPVNWKKGA